MQTFRRYPLTEDAGFCSLFTRVHVNDLGNPRSTADTRGGGRVGPQIRGMSTRGGGDPVACFGIFLTGLLAMEEGVMSCCRC